MTTPRQGIALHMRHGVRTVHRASTGCENGPGQWERDEHLLLKAQECFLTKAGEGDGERLTGTLLDLCIAVHKAEGCAGSDGAGKGGLAASRHADKNNMIHTALKKGGAFEAPP